MHVGGRGAAVPQYGDVGRRRVSSGMKDLAPTSFIGTAFHATIEANAPRTPADLPAYLDHALAHTLETGGRFNPAGDFGALYLSLDPKTPKAESDAPEVILELDARLTGVLDLRRPEALAKYGLTTDALCGGDHGPCQRAGRAIREDGYEAVRYPSAMGDGINLAVFWDRRRRDSSLRLAGRLDARGETGS
jgi:RES domain-containing protein